MNRTDRIEFLDVLRAFTIVLVMIMHTAMSYTPFSNWVHNAEPAGLLGIIIIFAESGVWMPILFFVAGYFTLSSLQKRGPGAFMKDKLIRIGIPFLIGIGLLSPALWLIAYYSEGGSLPIAQALASFFTLKHFSQFHFWFLGVLLFYFALVTLLSKRFPAILKARPDASHRPSAELFITLVAITSLLCFGINLFRPYSEWSCLVILQYQSVKVPLYNTYFLLGIYAYLRGWFQEGYRPRLWPWALIYILSFVFYLGLADRTNGNPVTLTSKLLMNTTASIEVLATLMTFTALFQKMFSDHRMRGMPGLRRLSSLGFTAYIVHLNILFVTLLLTRHLAVPLFLKYALQAGFTVVTSWGLAALYQRMTLAGKQPVQSTLQSQAGKAE